MEYLISQCVVPRASILENFTLFLPIPNILRTSLLLLDKLGTYESARFVDKHKVKWQIVLITKSYMKSDIKKFRNQNIYIKLSKLYTFYQLL